MTCAFCTNIISVIILLTGLINKLLLYIQEIHINGVKRQRGRQGFYDLSSYWAIHITEVKVQHNQAQTMQWSINPSQE